MVLNCKIASWKIRKNEQLENTYVLNIGIFHKTKFILFIKCQKKTNKKSHIVKTFESGENVVFFLLSEFKV